MGSPKQHKSLETQHHLFIFRRLLSLELQWLFLLLRSFTRCGLALHQQTHQPQLCSCSVFARLPVTQVVQLRTPHFPSPNHAQALQSWRVPAHHNLHFNPAHNTQCHLQLRLNRTSKDNQVYERMASAYRGKDRSTGPPPWMKFRMVKEVRQLRFFFAMHSPFTVAGRPLFSGTA